MSGFDRTKSVHSLDFNLLVSLSVPRTLALFLSAHKTPCRLLLQVVFVKGTIYVLCRDKYLYIHRNLVSDLVLDCEGLRIIKSNISSPSCTSCSFLGVAFSHPS